MAIPLKKISLPPPSVIICTSVFRETWSPRNPSCFADSILAGIEAESRMQIESICHQSPHHQGPESENENEGSVSQTWPTENQTNVIKVVTVAVTSNMQQPCLSSPFTPSRSTFFPPLLPWCFLVLGGSDRHFVCNQASNSPSGQSYFVCMVFLNLMHCIYRKPSFQSYYLYSIKQPISFFCQENLVRGWSLHWN